MKVSITLLDMLVWSSYNDVIFLATTHAPITDNQNLEYRPYFGLDLLDNLADLLLVVDVRSILLSIFYPFSPSQYGMPLGDADDC